MKIKVEDWRDSKEKMVEVGSTPQQAGERAAVIKIYYDSIYNWLMMTSMRGGCGCWMSDHDDDGCEEEAVILFATWRNRWWAHVDEWSRCRDKDVKTARLRDYTFLHWHEWELLGMFWMEQDNDLRWISRLLFILIEEIVWETNTIQALKTTGRH